MQSQVALLRAVNVGGTGKLPMAELRSMAEAAGFAHARTYIQSGNLVYSTSVSPEAAKTALEQRLEAYAGKPVGVAVRTGPELQAILGNNPFPGAEPAKVGVLFLDTSVAAPMAGQAKGRSDEEILAGERELYIHYPSGMGRSRLQLAAQSNGTMRNINTVRKLAEMAQGNSG